MAVEKRSCASLYCLATNQVVIIIIIFSVFSNVDGDNSKLVFTCRTMNIPAQKS